MNPLSILSLILSLAPSGLSLTQEIISLVQAIETAINATPGSPEHTAAVTTLNTQAAKVSTPAPAA